MNRSQVNLQDTFLNQARKESIGVTIYLVNGVQLRGVVRGFDSFTVLLDSPGKPGQLVYKHAITSVVPSRPIHSNYLEALREAGHGDETDIAGSNGRSIPETIELTA